MKYTSFLFVIVFSLGLISCQQAEDPQPTPSSRTVADSLSVQLSGSWQSKTIAKSYYTNDELTEQENSEAIETYNFTQTGDFQLIQDSFAIKGTWVLTRSGNVLLVSTESGEVLHWEVKELTDEQLILYSSQTVMVGENAQRLETHVLCTKVLN